MKGDFTRSTWDRRQRYTSVRMQQGRVQIDADWNEQADLQTHLRETALRDVLGQGAVPEDGGGFAIQVAPASNGLHDDLLISDGRLWIDGILCELGPGVEALIAEFSEDNQVQIAQGELEPGDLRQGDWIELRAAGLGNDERGEMARITEISEDGRDFTLDRDVADAGTGARLRRWTSLGSQRDLPPPPEGAEAPEDGTHLVYLDAWQHHVTALEDPEIRETALGGPDTATRVRTVCQVKLLPLDLQEIDEDADGIPEGSFGCDDDLDAWDDLVARPTGRLRARTRPVTDPEDPCQVPSGGGYVGLENQLYRIEVHDGGELGEDATFKWSRDNGTVVTDWLGQDGDVLRVRSVGRDHTLSFHDAHWVELTDEGRELRGEPGVIVPLLKVVDEEHLQVDLTDVTVDHEDFPLHPKVRRWDLPATADGALPIEMVAENEGYLQLDSGIEIRFEPGTYRTGDYWWIPARAFVGEGPGDIEWPRDAGGVPLARSPHGIEHHYLRLALVEHDGEGFVEGSETDCRDPFCTLPEACRTGDGGCCTVTVGEVGDFQSLQEAIESLPRETGGEVCVHPGDYDGTVEIAGRRNVTIRGCGGRPRLTHSGEGPVVRITGSRSVTLRHLEIDGDTGVGIEMSRRDELLLEDVLLDDLVIRVRSESAVVGLGGRRIILRESRVLARSVSSAAGAAEQGTRPAVFLSGDDLAIEGNRIEAASLRPAGGVQIGGGSRRVAIRDNDIRGGHGNGITLGSVRFIEEEPEDPILIFDHFEAIPFEEPSPLFSIDATLDREVLVWNPDRGDDDPIPISDGDLEDVRILDNEISEMGANGIAVARFFDVSDDAESPEVIFVDDLLVESNHVHDCLRMALGALPDALQSTAAYGGISLAGGERITLRTNVIENNGRDRLEPVCGVYVLHGVGLSFEGNRIVGNGRPVDPEVETLPGQRGGIVLGLAEAPTESVTPSRQGRITALRQDGTPALRVHGNVVVSPEGRALEVVALGPVSILGNQLTAHGSHLRRQTTPTTGPAFFAARTDTVLDSVNGAAFLSAADLRRMKDPTKPLLDTLGGAVVAVTNAGVSTELGGRLSDLGGEGLAGTGAFSAARTRETPVFVGGNVLFHDNQVVLDAFRPATTYALSSVTLASGDDVSMLGNQCDCDMVLDAVVVNAVVLGASIRVTHNRFEEGLFTFLSAMTFGWLNSTRDNQGTHCFFAVGHPQLSTTSPNASLVDVLIITQDENPCARWRELSRGISTAIGNALP